MAGIRTFPEDQHPLVCGRTYLERKSGESCERKMRAPSLYGRSLNSAEAAEDF